MKRKLAVASWIFAILFATVSLFIPPQGEIDSSVLVLVAQLLVLCATFLGVDEYINIIRRSLDKK